MEIMSVHKAIDILNLLQQEGELGVTEIAKALHINKSTIFRLLFTLKQGQLVSQNPENERYRLGIKLYALGETVRESINIRSFSEPILQSLSEEVGEYVHLSVLNPAKTDIPRLIVVAKVSTSRPLSLHPVLKAEVPCHCSAMGKCLLAFQPEEYLDQFSGQPLNSLTEHTITDWGALRERLEIIRERGYDIEISEIEVGLACVAFPIFGLHGEVIAAFSVSGPETRIIPNQELLITKMGIVSKQLSYVI